MKFGKILNRDKTPSRDPRKEEAHLKVTKETFHNKNDLSGGPPHAHKDNAFSEAPVGRPEAGHLRLGEKREEERRLEERRVERGGPKYSSGASFTDASRHPRASSTTTDDIPILPPLQVTNENEVHRRGLAPLPEEVVDPDGFDLAPAPRPDWERPELFSLERRSLLLFSKAHLRIIFRDLKLLRRFSAFLVEHRPESVPLLVYHLDVRKALAAIKYTNAVTEMLRPLDALDFTREPAPKTSNEVLRRKADASFEVLAHQDLPAWITSVWMKAVEVSIRRRINGSLPSQLRDLSEGLAETFVLSDPARHDNPILFASEEFNRMTQYANKYVIGRNCRIFQGPKSDPHGIARIREKLNNGEQHYEPLLNYRRDGSPFMNLLMITPLLDGQGKVRYYLGAQIDTSGLLNDFYGFEHLHRYVDKDGYTVGDSDQDDSGFDSQDDTADKGELQELSELFNQQELDTIRTHGGRLHHPDLQEPSASWKKKQRLVIAPEVSLGDGDLDGPHDDGRTAWSDDDELDGHGRATGMNGQRSSVSSSINGHAFSGAPSASGAAGRNSNNKKTHRDRIMSPGSDPSFLSGSQHHSASASFDAEHGGHLGGVYDHYLLVRPAPHLRILFASPSLRVPGMVQSGLMERIGGSATLRRQIEDALMQGQSVTAKVRWLSTTRREMQQQQQQQQGGGQTQTQPAGRSRWIHATPLLGRNGEVGVWMVVLVDEEREGGVSLSSRHGGGGGGGGGRSTRPASMRSSMQESVAPPPPPQPQPQPSSVRSRNGSVNFHGTDAGSVMELEPPERLSTGDGLRPPPSSHGKKGMALVYDEAGGKWFKVDPSRVGRAL